MKIHVDRFKLLLKKRSIGGWIFWALAGCWKLLGHWQNVDWLGNHLFPKAWPSSMLHPNYITIGLLVGGFVWFTIVLFWPRKKGPRLAGRITSLEGLPDTATTPMAMAVIEEKKEPGWDEHPMNWQWFAKVSCVNESEFPTTIDEILIMIKSEEKQINVKCTEDFGRYVFAKGKDDEIPNLLKKLRGVPLTYGIGHDGWVHFSVSGMTRKNMESAEMDIYLVDAMQRKHILQKCAEMKRVAITKKLSG